MAVVTNQVMTFASGVYNPYTHIVLSEKPICTIMEITIPIDWMKFVIGKEGKFFNVITYQAGVQYIWYHKNTKMVEIWGYSDVSINDAVKRIKDRMDRICLNMLTNSGMYRVNDNGEHERVLHVKWSDIRDDDETSK